MTEKYQTEYPNSHYLTNLNNLNRTNNAIDLNRLPTLGEILANKTNSPVDLFTFYKFMKEVENKSEFLDFWFDLINHLNLCKYYVKGLRSSLVKSQNRASNFSENHKSLSSSVLLDLIINDDILSDNDSNRLSQFLRGDLNVSDPKLADLINQYDEEQQNRKSQNPSTKGYEGIRPPSGFSSIGENRYSATSEKRVSSNSKLLDSPAGNDSFVESKLDPNQQQTGENYAPVKRRSSISPSLLEKLIKNSPDLSESSSFITRQNLKESTQNLLLKYFVEDAEKNLYLPSSMNNHIVKSIEVDGRDDPDIFNQVRSYVFSRIENEHLPNFLNFIAIKNLHSNFIRIIVGILFVFFGFWIGYSLIFLDYSKGIRAVTVVPFLIGFYCLVSSIYLIDPVLVWFRLSESFENSSRFIKIREPFIFKLLLKRSLWVCFLILLCTAVFTLIFSLVPGHRL